VLKTQWYRLVQTAGLRQQKTNPITLYRGIHVICSEQRT